MATKRDDGKILENKIADNLAMLIYATMDDIERGWNGDLPAEGKHLSYKTICMPKKTRPAGLTSKFTIADPVRQFLAFIFNNYVVELTNANLLKDDTVEDIKAKAIDSNCECYTEFMMNLSAHTRGLMEETLMAAGDATHWFRARLVGKLPNYNMCDKLISLIYLEFVDFIKSVAYLLGSMLWYAHGNITPGLFLGTMKQFNMNQIMLDMLESCVREKLPKVAKPVTTDIAITDIAITDIAITDIATIDEAKPVTTDIATTDEAKPVTTDIASIEANTDKVDDENNLLDILNNI